MIPRAYLAAIAATFACIVSAGIPMRAAETPAAATFSPEEVEQIVAPIALYPDALLAQVFMASTYPLEIVEAARFASEHKELKDAALDEALKDKTWDASVKSLVYFPQVLTMMNEKLDWTQKLGDAFLAQQKEVMDAVQRLRARAHEAGNLESTKEQKVTVEPAKPTNVTVEQAPTNVVVEQAPTEVVVQQAPPTVIKIEQANPQVVYVPAYDPVVVYGPWPYPAYPPYYYYPPGYIAGSALWFGAGMAAGAAIWGDCDWNNDDVDINISDNDTFSRNTERTNVDRGDRGDGERGDRERGDRGRDDKRRDDKGRDSKGRDAKQGDRGGKQKWNHDPSHRKGAQYRDKATQQKYDRSGPKGAESREAFRGRAEQGREQIAREGAGQMQRDVDRANANSARDRSGTTSRDRAGATERDRSGNTTRDKSGNTTRDRSGATTRDRSGQPERSASSRDNRSGSSSDRSSTSSQRSRSSGSMDRGADPTRSKASGREVRCGAIRAVGTRAGRAPRAAREAVVVAAAAAGAAAAGEDGIEVSRDVASGHPPRARRGQRRCRNRRRARCPTGEIGDGTGGPTTLPVGGGSRHRARRRGQER
jgi:hypothetical protein